jgi:hypothetical protein
MGNKPSRPEAVQFQPILKQPVFKDHVMQYALRPDTRVFCKAEGTAEWVRCKVIEPVLQKSDGRNRLWYCY